MKPSELTGVTNARATMAYSGDAKTLNKYIFQDCIIAYKKCFMGSVFLIKGKIGYFGFVFNKKGMPHYAHDITRIELPNIQAIFNEEKYEEDKVIVNEEEYKSFERKVLFNSIARREEYGG